jgi:excisionase family DNA binding protein
MGSGESKPKRPLPFYVQSFGLAAMSSPTRMNDGEASKSRITVVRTSNTNSRLSDFEQLAREAAAAVCKEFSAKEFAKLREPRTWFDLQGAAAYLVVSEQTLSRYVKEHTAPPSVKVGNGRRFHRSDLDAWIRAGGILAFKKAEGADANSKSIPPAEDEISVQGQRAL